MPNKHRSPDLPSPSQPLDVDQLRRFHAVARAGGFTAAARVLHVAQPAVSRSIASLEEDLGRKLIERTSRRFALTPLGARLADACATLFERVDALRTLAQTEEVDIQGALRVGSSEAVASGLLPRTLATLMGRHPHLHPYVVVAPTRDLANRLAARDLDLVLTFNALKGGAHARERVALFRFALVVASTHVHDARTCETFLGSREVEEDREVSFPTLEKWRAKWPATRIRASTNSITLHLELARAGVGVAVVPEFLVHQDLRSGRLAKMQAPGVNELAFPLLAFRRKGSPSPLARAFLDTLRETVVSIPGRVANA